MYIEIKGYPSCTQKTKTTLFVTTVLERTCIDDHLELFSKKPHDQQFDKKLELRFILYIQHST